ncbi:hypothetical protein P4S72_09255 [Vibrio sp. PP-XX7]
MGTIMLWSIVSEPQSVLPLEGLTLIAGIDEDSRYARERQLMRFGDLAASIVVGASEDEIHMPLTSQPACRARR